MSDPKQRDLDSIGHAAAWLRERSNDPDPIPSGRAKDKRDWLAQGKPDLTVAHLRPVEPQPVEPQVDPQDSQAHSQAHSEAHKQPDIFAEAVARAMQEQGEPDLVEAPFVLQNRHAFVGITARFAVAIGVSALVALVFVAAFPALQGPVDEDGSSSLPAWKSLRSSLSPAPPRKPAATSARPDGTVGASASAATVPSSPAAPTPQQQRPIAAGPPSAARAEPPVREINPDEVAGFVRRGQDLLTTGDLQAARLLLLRAAEAHDARAALLLAKTFDPIVSKQFGVADAEPDLAQARNWYRKAEEWGASEARRELDALASYTR